MSTDNIPAVEEKPKNKISIVWILPVIAACIGGWLLYKSIVDAPISITIEFDSGEGIQAGKTMVRYEGLEIGKVTDIELNKGLVGVVASVDIDRRAKITLHQDTQFWLVKPEISLSGITGLSTVITGNYISMRIGSDKKESRHFNALSKSPPLPNSAPGLHLKLHAADLGSINHGSPILYKKMVVGSVQEYNLDKSGARVNLNVFIKPQYSQFVRKDSRFWNASGISIQGGLSGVDIRTESLAAVLMGGIALSELNEQSSSELASNDDVYALLDDYIAAESGVKVEVEFPVAGGLKANSTEVRFRGIKVGQVESALIKEDLSGLAATLNLNPLVKDYINESSQFWLDKPSFSLGDLSGIGALLDGSYVGVRLSTKGTQPQYKFTALHSAPLLDQSAPGLHIVLNVETLGSIRRGTELLYCNVSVGSVVDYQFLENSRLVELQLHVKPEYSHLVNRSSRFWDVSGIEVEGGLSGIKIHTQSLLTIMAGGISFYTPDSNARGVKNGASFCLYDDYDAAHLRGTSIALKFDNADGLQEGTIIKYQGIRVGEVKSLRLNASMDGCDLNLMWRFSP